jgi:hypothetical protein
MDKGLTVFDLATYEIRDTDICEGNGVDTNIRGSNYKVCPITGERIQTQNLGVSGSIWTDSNFKYIKIPTGKDSTTGELIFTCYNKEAIKKFILSQILKNIFKGARTKEEILTILSPSRTPIPIDLIKDMGSLFDLNAFINRSIRICDSEKDKFQFLYDPNFYFSWNNTNNNPDSKNIFVIYCIYRYCFDVTTILASHLTEEEYAQQIITDVIRSYLNFGYDDTIFVDAFESGYLPIVSFDHDVIVNEDVDTFVVNYQNHPYFLFRPFYQRYPEQMKAYYNSVYKVFQDVPNTSRSSLERPLPKPRGIHDFIYNEAMNFVERIEENFQIFERERQRQMRNQVTLIPTSNYNNNNNNNNSSTADMDTANGGSKKKKKRKTIKKKKKKKRKTLKKN